MKTIQYQIPKDILESFLLEVQKNQQSTEERVLVTANELADLITLVFWSSLLTEEGDTAQPALLLMPQSRSRKAGFQFKEKISVTPKELAKLAGALNHREYLAVDIQNGDWFIWGIVTGPTTDIFIDVEYPGTITLGQFIPHIVLDKEKVHVIDNTLRLQGVNILLNKLVGHNKQYLLWALLGIVRVARGFLNGGTLVIVNGDDWRNKADVSKESNPPYNRLSHAIEQYAKIILEENVGRKNLPGLLHVGEKSAMWSKQEEEAGEHIAKLTTVDGAVILDNSFNLLSFGTKLMPSSIPEKIGSWSPIEGSEYAELSLDKFGGTRHQSAIRFIADVKDALAIVISQDGPVKIVYWDAEKNMPVVIKDAERIADGYFKE